MVTHEITKTEQKVVYVNSIDFCFLLILLLLFKIDYYFAQSLLCQLNKIFTMYTVCEIDSLT